MNAKKKGLRAAGIAIIAILLALLVVVDVLAVRFNTVITRFWSGTFSSVSTESEDTQIKAMDAAAELTETVEEEGAVLLKNNGLLPMAPTGTTGTLPCWAMRLTLPCTSAPARSPRPAATCPTISLTSTMPLRPPDMSAIRT